MTLEKVFADVFSVQESTISNSTSLRDIPTWDSMAHMMLILRLEETYKVQFTGDQIADMKTVADARKAIRTNGGNA